MIALATLLAALLVSLVTAPVAAAQEDAAHDHSPARLGRVSFPVSCTPEAQRRFEHAMAVLRSFWWEEGERAFGAVLAAMKRSDGGRADLATARGYLRKAAER